MPSLIEIQHNPYLPQMRLLIDGSRPSEYSQLLQYTDEDAWIWLPNILDAIYAETRRAFTVRFCGSELDAKALELLCNQYEQCRGFETRKFYINESLQARMKKLNQFIQGMGITTFQKRRSQADFVFLEDTERCWQEIQELDVNNSFCSIQPHLLPPSAKNLEGDFAVVLAKSVEAAETWIQAVKPNSLSFALIFSTEDKLLRTTKDTWYFATTKEGMFPTIFQCFLEKPLLEAFRSCVKELGKHNNSKELRKISSVEPIFDVQIDQMIEVGRSSKIQITTDPPMSYPPEVNFKVQNGKIATADQFSVFGNLPGDTSIEVYRPGEGKPFKVIPITVYTRNRINKIILSEDELILGNGDTFAMGMDYSPDDADNSNEITWKSTDPKIVQVDEHGRLYARKPGECRIICVAENVAAQCKVKVRPYLESIEIDQTLEEGILILEPQEERTVNVLLYPANAFDDVVIYSSSDLDVVNVIGDTLYAKKIGDATLTIRNNTGRIEKVILVQVRKEKKPGVFHRFFNK